MKIRDEAVRHSELKSGHDEKICGSDTRSGCSKRFERANRGCPHRHKSLPLLSFPEDTISRTCGNFIAFMMEFFLLKLLFRYRRESTKTHLKRQ